MSMATRTLWIVGAGIEEVNRLRYRTKRKSRAELNEQGSARRNSICSPAYHRSGTSIKGTLFSHKLESHGQLSFLMRQASSMCMSWDELPRLTLDDTTIFPLRLARLFAAAISRSFIENS